MADRVVSLDAYRQERAERICGVGILRRARLVDGRIMVSTSLDDEALALLPSEARYLAAMLVMLAGVVDGGSE